MSNFSAAQTAAGEAKFFEFTMDDLPQIGHRVAFFNIVAWNITN
jgi:hypothetical protein